MCATPSCFAIWGRLSGVLLKCCVEVREMTFRSATFANRVRISSCTPSQKYALSGSRLRLSNGSTAIDFFEAALEQMGDPELFSDLTQIVRRAFVFLSGTAGDNL